MILEAVKQDKALISIGNDAKILDLIQRITPTHYSQTFNFLTKKTLKKS